jgi:hypothetical protein
LAISAFKHAGGMTFPNGRQDGRRSDDPDEVRACQRSLVVTATDDVTNHGMTADEEHDQTPRGAPSLVTTGLKRRSTAPRPAFSTGSAKLCPSERGLSAIKVSLRPDRRRGSRRGSTPRDLRDATALLDELRAFLGWLRGERRHCCMAAIPTVKEEDARRPTRERANLVGERTRIVNQMKAILARFGIRSFQPTLAQSRGKARRSAHGGRGAIAREHACGAGSKHAGAETPEPTKGPAYLAKPSNAS